ncbi:uncharacterized protein B0I36DRAFT_242481 [Microdochium trichocladiopsis]|uniref:Atos-like conserved domain-containing protein n=1 Tax=Microdochium trichocladiopsis TaxID=1682393 RepID=A0A9P8Y727_9PEZI|nr:uncharacterized protein B0I36DRAFT_242481 [Microdochium trichocladiopsis]KAH7031108.1 hypothetical protein B0I36DRAFT_242481 [Microdochium trichocladiopsis]
MDHHAPAALSDPHSTNYIAAGARPSVHRRLSEESLPVELCDGPLPDFSSRPRTPARADQGVCTDRAELIERLKRSQSPTWTSTADHNQTWTQPADSTAPGITPERRPVSPVMFPPITITPEKGKAKAPTQDSPEATAKLQYGLSIERPRSALHSGDFTQDERPSHQTITGQFARPRHGSGAAQFGSTHDSPWLATSPPRDFTSFHFERRQSNVSSRGQPLALSTSLSSSITSSFAYQPPTSPLVQSESNDENDYPSSLAGIDIGSGFSRNNRRHTLMSTHSGAFNFSPSPASRHPPVLRQEKSFPYQAHQPRRSLTSTPSSLPFENFRQFPASRSRRPSLGSDASPIQHASMVGSYEESILRGRMSTTPSKPLEFVAQIGVLGLGKCKSSLRCPPHVTLPFPAVFYSYASSAYGRSKTEDGPSPYVGQIDLENGLPNQEGSARAKRKMQTRTTDRIALGDDGNERFDRARADGSDFETRRAQRQKRRSGSPRAPPGGSYRIPEKGQIQIIIKNPNKTAVKLFLVPYDLAGMEAGTKTFIRQRSYSAGPIIENMPAAADSGSAERPTLRYLVHLHICCPSKGRFYLYKSIRVVFANRVPDGKERLRNEVSAPEPKYSSYKPIRVMHPPTTGGSGPAASMAAEKAFRRRSSGYYAGMGTSSAFDAMDGVVTPGQAQMPFSFSFGNGTPIEPVPFSLARKDMKSTAPAASLSPEHLCSSTHGSEAAANGNAWNDVERYNKLSPGDSGYGGNAFSGLINGSPAVAESLLSQRLRTLGVRGLDRADSTSESCDQNDATGSD